METKLSLGNYCSHNCMYCYMDSNTEENFIHHKDIAYEDYKGQIVVLTGGNPLVHPKLIEILSNFKKLNIECKIEVYQHDIQDNNANLQMLKFLVKLKLVSEIYISIGYLVQRFIKVLEGLPIVFVGVVGLFRNSDYVQLKGKKIRLKLVGFISQGRGKDWIKKNEFGWNFNLEWLKENFMIIAPSFEEIILDDLAKQQLEIS